MGKGSRPKRQETRNSRSEGAARRHGEALAERMTRGWGALVTGADKGASRLRDSARELRRSPAFQHALAARERGNLEAAFWLLAEEYDARPDDPEVSFHYWHVALDLQRIDLAAPAGVRLVQRHAAAGEIDLAAQYWMELASAAPDSLVTPTAIASILPALRRHLAEVEEDERGEVLALVRRAVRDAVDPRNEDLAPGVALRLFEEGRDVNPQSARRAAEVALASPHLHETKRVRLQAWLEGREIDDGAARSAPRKGAAPVPTTTQRKRAGRSNLESLSDEQVSAAAARLPPSSSPAPPAAASPSPLRRVEAGDSTPELPPEPTPQVGLTVLAATPVELADDAFLFEVANDRRLRVEYSEIEAVSVGEVAGLADLPVAVIDLVLNWTRRDEEPLRTVRLRADSFDPTALAPGPCAAGGGLAALLGEILDRSHAVPLPDPESALGLCLTCYESLEAYERESLRRISSSS